jgi:glycosyltransferase involved in cell wall biosynthesis
MNRAPVSVVIPCYKSSETVRRAVDSVLNQTAPPREIILVDDCSGDTTLAVLKRIAAEHAEPAIRVIALERNVGPGAARNEGWRAATQPYIALLDHDDSWHPRKLEIQYGWMAAHPEVGLTSHALVEARAADELPRVPAQCDAQLVGRRELLLSNRFQTSTVMLRANLPFRFDESRQYLEDYLLWLEIVLHKHPAVRLDAPLAMQHKAIFGEGGLSAQLWTMEKGELNAYRRVLREGLISFPAFVFLLLFSLAKYAKRLVVSRLRTARARGVSSGRPLGS